MHSNIHEVRTYVGLLSFAYPGVAVGWFLGRFRVLTQVQLAFTLTLDKDGFLSVLLLNMPRLQYIFVITAPFFAIFLIFRSFAVNRHIFEAVAQRLNLPWPLAVHPDFPDAQMMQDDFESQYYFNDDHHDDYAGAGHHPAYDQHEEEYVPQHYPDFPSGEVPTFSRRIVAVGDLHGDLRNAHAVLQMAGVVDSKGNWAHGADYFVQTGDIIDRWTLSNLILSRVAHWNSRGDDTIKLYLWMDKLREQARAAGGEVLSHLGNHEWMNAIGRFRLLQMICNKSQSLYYR